ncbi:hypothetical protein [Microbispora sp. ATCC PTA-5024]|uniref:hypothetical protein n=1 Tax=Microbispora sp. ATCC PTA-5024 TaxID=316330 RepID=UPI0003DBE252|nr:hypothetical protein [Microbispora sp. ATCC PTA-5024]ETK37794.1 hypothetical protein MPTA5024_02340 [Microbispora sp. ATCC PTA-5024]
MESELFPIVSAILAGLLIELVRPSARLWAGGLLALVLGALATFVSGESEISWAFLLFDIPLVAVTSFATIWAVRLLRRRSAERS